MHFEQNYHSSLSIATLIYKQQAQLRKPLIVLTISSCGYDGIICFDLTQSVNKILEIKITLTIQTLGLGYFS